MKTRAHVFVFGEVTGVGFRFWAQKIAAGLGLTGWVRNAESHLVELVLEGEEEKVKEMIKKCYFGPPSAFVEKVEVKSEEPTGEFKSFDIIY